MRTFALSTEDEVSIRETRPKNSSDGLSSADNVRARHQSFEDEKGRETENIQYSLMILGGAGVYFLSQIIVESRTFAGALAIVGPKIEMGKTHSMSSTKIFNARERG